MRRALVLSAVAACSHPTGGGLLTHVTDVAMPGRATRFDYQEVSAGQGQLVVAHMDDDAVLVLDLRDGAVRAQLTGIATPRGVAVAEELGLIFVTSMPDRLVIIDSHTLQEVARVATGAGPDGDAWDPVDQIVGVSDQRDGALSLIAGAGRGTRTPVALGVETGNVTYDAPRGWFWITVVTASPPDQLVAVDPKTAAVTARIALPGCGGAHGLRLHPDGQSAYVACEDDDRLARVDLGGDHALSTAPTGKGPDVMALDPVRGWLYVAAEHGELSVFDLQQPGVALVGRQAVGDHAHTVAVDPATHRVFLPLPAGDDGTPVLRIMRPAEN
ncbi:MAG: hypothetical protein K8W52_31405 [Deltaproteobacteria bacterium]|nr:hypothetical protein [Deltaproteobacteria bacterium]